MNTIARSAYSMGLVNTFSQVVMGVVTQTKAGEKYVVMTVQEVDGKVEEVHVSLEWFRNNREVVGQTVICARIRRQNFFLPSDSMSLDGINLIHIVSPEDTGKVHYEKY